MRINIDNKYGVTEELQHKQLTNSKTTIKVFQIANTQDIIHYITPDNFSFTQPMHEAATILLSKTTPFIL